MNNVQLTMNSSTSIHIIGNRKYFNVSPLLEKLKNLS